MIRTASLKQRLISYLVVLIILVWIAMTVSAYNSVRDELRSFLDTQLSQIAYALLEINFENIQDYDATIPEDIANYLDSPDNLDIRYQIWREGKLVLYSLDAPKSKLELQEGFSNFSFNNENWRGLHLITKSKEALEIIVIANQDIEALFIYPMSNIIVLHLMFQLFAVIVAIWYGVGRGLLPLNRLAQKIAAKNYGDLRPIPEKYIPQEIIPLTEALNSLFKRLNKAFEDEREFTNHAAHELRTPLAALKTQAQVAFREKDKNKQQQQLHNIIHAVNRATHLLNQLLDLARLDPEISQLKFEKVDIGAIANTIIQEQKEGADKKHIRLLLNCEPYTWVIGHSNYLAVMLRNLIDNAIRYAPQDSDVKVSLYKDKKDKTVTMMVEDQGKKIPEDKHEKIFDRFYRMPGSKPHGIGIGLSIVRKIVELHKASIIVDCRKKGGNCFKIKFALTSLENTDETKDSLF